MQQSDSSTSGSSSGSSDDDDTDSGAGDPGAGGGDGEVPPPHLSRYATFAFNYGGAQEGAEARGEGLPDQQEGGTSW